LVFEGEEEEGGDQRPARPREGEALNEPLLEGSRADSRLLLKTDEKEEEGSPDEVEVEFEVELADDSFE